MMPARSSLGSLSCLLDRVNVLAEHQKMSMFTTPYFLNDSLYDKGFNYKLLDLLNNNKFIV